MGRLISTMLTGLAAAVAAACSAPPAGEDDLGVRFHGLVIHVADMDEALDFYSGFIGFAQRDTLSEGFTRLDSETPLYLHETGAARRVSDEQARTSFGFQTNDIDARVAEWRAEGVAFDADAPRKVGVGRAIEFRDPFGAAVYLLQQDLGEPAPVEEPVIYNTGFSHVDPIALQALYVDTLGFTVRTMNYYPPAIPLGHEDGSFAFMLHETADAPADPEAYRSGSGGVLVFEAPDLDRVRRALQDEGVVLVDPAPAPGFPYERLAIQDGEGVVSEVWELP